MTGATAIDDYLRDVAAGLSGPARIRKAVMAELADGLRCAAADHQHAGRSAGTAAAAAIAEFGDPAAVARAFAPEMAAATARRSALLLVRSGPAIGAVWLLSILMTAPEPTAAQAVWVRAVTAVMAYVPVLPVAIVCAATAAALVFAATGVSLRVLPARTAVVAPYAAVAVAAATVTADLALLSALPSLLAQTAPVWPLLAIAAVTSGTRLAASGWWACQCLALGGRTVG